MSRGRFCCRHRVRPEHVPLAPSSAHQPAVHSWWPRAHIRSTSRICTLRADYTTWVEGFLRRLSRFHHPDVYVDWLRCTALKPDLPRIARSKPDTLWLVVDWHSAHLHGGLGKQIRRFFESELSRARLSSEIGHDLAVGLAWRVAGPKLTTFTGDSRRMEVGVVGGEGGSVI